MIEVNVTCAWCQAKVVTSLKAPVPDGWVQEMVSGADVLENHDETFCSKDHGRLYTDSLPSAIKAAVESYGTTFLARMNDARTKWKQRPEAV